MKQDNKSPLIFNTAYKNGFMSYINDDSSDIPYDYQSEEYEHFMDGWVDASSIYIKVLATSNNSIQKENQK